ncbi:MAG: ABC transporter ATP-binding protein [Bradymonadales bacterium]|nr:ABC transporter ATP-binding protein [Bradymonadales bacterium]
MTHLVESASWPAAQAAEAISALLAHRRFHPRAVELPAAPSDLDELEWEKSGGWIEQVASLLGAEAQPVETPYPEVAGMLSSLAPGVVLIRVGEQRRLLLVCSSKRDRIGLLGPDLREHRVLVESVRAVVCQTWEARIGPEVDRLLELVKVKKRRRARAREVILKERLGPVQIGGCWFFRLPPGAGFLRQVRHAGLTRHLAALLLSHTLQYLLFLGSWWLIGRGALQGRLETGWLVAWGLILLTMVPFKLWTVWAQGLFSIGAGGLLKRRLLHGALNLHPDVTRHQGSGQLLGRVIESEAVEFLALSGGFLAMMTVVELALATLVLVAGAGGWPHGVMLLVFVAATLLGAWHLARRQDSWTTCRLDLTNDLVEQMVGHRTRLAQQPPDQWHRFEDQAVAQYFTLSHRMDRARIRLLTFIPRGWTLVGVAILASAFVAGGAGLGPLAVGLGGIILGQQALFKLCAGVNYLTAAGISYKQVAPLFQAAAIQQTGDLTVSRMARQEQANSAGSASAPVIEAENLVFRYLDRGDPVLDGCNLHIRQQEKLLLEGPSGGGKSTLVSLLVGLRQPDSGLLLLDGLDRRTLGSDGWRRRIVAAPQFHENHVLTETFAFNLLMGRRWPPAPGDLEEAEAICEELGLGELLRRMPGGMLQTVGETGWQLSHGERSRLFIARTLLQGAKLVVLDESFASLDPVNLRQALQCVLRRAPTLLVVAHP